MCFTTAFSTVKRWRITGERETTCANSAAEVPADIYGAESSAGGVSDQQRYGTPVTRITIAAGTTRQIVLCKLLQMGRELRFWRRLT